MEKSWSSGVDAGFVPVRQEQAEMTERDHG